MDHQRLEKNIIDNIREAQLKLGYEERPISFNYLTSSLCHLLGTENIEGGELLDFLTYTYPRLGKVTFSPIRDGYCVTVSAEGTAYVHSHPDKSRFLIDFIETVRNHHNTIEDVFAVFNRHSGSVTIEELHNEEFDYLVYFADGIPDDYRYCLTLEPCMDGGCHITYHRFIPEDYEDLGF